jgi:uncharacterized protein (TIGR00369 family)
MFDIQNYKHIIEEVIPFHKVLGLQLVFIESGKAQIMIPFRPTLVGDPRTDRIHGGVIATAMDAAGGAAAITTLTDPRDQLSTIDIRVDYLYPGKPEDIIVEGKIVKDGKNIIFTQMKAFHAHAQELIAEGRAIYKVKRV